MQVIILCGGKGTRLREETEFKPKPMIDVGGKPLLWHLLQFFSNQGLKDFCLCLGYKGDQIKHYFLHYEAMNRDCTIALGGTQRQISYHDKGNEMSMSVTLADTGEEALTGARVKRVEHLIKGDTFLITYGDGLSDVDIGKLLDFHRSHGKAVTITSFAPFSRFGVLKLDNDGVTVRSFQEKPQLDGLISAGFLVCNRKLFEYLSTDDSCSLETDGLEKLAQEGQLAAYHHPGFFYSMDTYRDYLHLNAMWNAGNRPWANWLQSSK